MSNNQVSNNQMVSDYLVTQQVNTSALPTTQVQSDLDVLKDAESSLTDNSSSPTVDTPIIQKKIIDPNTPQELLALKLQNPFKGE